MSIANQQLRTNEQLLWNDNFDEMNISEDPNRSEGEQFYSLETNDFSSDTTHVNSSNENMQSAETGNAHLNEQQNGQLDFCNWYLEQLHIRVNNVAGYLPPYMPTEHYKFMQDCQQNPQNLFSKEGFNMFLSTIQYGQRILQILSQDSAVGEESDKIFNQNTSAPFDDNEEHTAEQIQTLTQSVPPVSHISENDPLPKPALDLSKLLLDQSGTIKGKLLFKLKLLHPPKPFWHARTTKCLAKKECCPLQSTTERQCIVLEWSNLTNFNEHNLFVHVQLLSYDGKTHSSKFIVPPNTSVEDINEQRVLIDCAYGCNIMNKTILFPLKTVKCPNHPNQITLPVFMFNPFKVKQESKDKQGSNTDEIDLNFVKNEIEKICKLRIEMCQLTNGLLECVCEHIDTNFIKESKGTKELEPIDASKITPSNPCECGHEDISVLLNTNSEKAGFIVIINERRLKIHEFNGVTKNTITIHPPPKTSQANDFHLIIKKINVLKTIEQNLNPFDMEDLKIDTLLDIKVKYANHNYHCPHIIQTKKSRKE